MAESTPQPTLYIEEGVDAGMAARIQSMSRRFDHNPEDFRFTLEFLGSTLTERTLELSDEERLVPTTSQEPADLMKEWFSHRYDAHVTYDDATEDALMNDSTYQGLIKTHRGEQRPEHKGEARNAVRRYRFAFYIGRLVDWQNERLLTESFPKAYSSA